MFSWCSKMTTFLVLKKTLIYFATTSSPPRLIYLFLPQIHLNHKAYFLSSSPKCMSRNKHKKTQGKLGNALISMQSQVLPCVFSPSPCVFNCAPCFSTNTRFSPQKDSHYTNNSIENWNHQHLITSAVKKKSY